MSSCLRRSKNSDKAAENEAFMMKNGEILLEKLIASSNGKYNPIRNFSTEEINISTNNFETGKVLIQDDYAYELYKGHLHDQESESRVKVKYLKGALGYIAPEYMEALVHNEKCDVYNFGGLLLLLLTGKRVHDLARGTKDESVLSGYVKKHSENNRLFEIVGPIIVGDDQGLCPEKEQQLQDFKELALR
ncbi:hypothetical protein LWI28_022096 [Acer negundo]|uniref:Protein kinase domain-containing protein n=1 Tax=Acer negundo TaxID=4023 RepID=A0AAD5JAU1_ACENE|nr:hypothetical protein LWI28_022096 [Acer negundo]